jgi:hypothetical protein
MVDSLCVTRFGLRRACLALLGAVLLGLGMFSAEPPLALACNVLEPCDPPGPGGTLTSVSRVPAGVRLQGNLTILTKVPATLYGYVTSGPVTTVSTSTRAFDFTIPAEPGTMVCVDVTSGQLSGSVGCKSFTVALNPFGSMDDASWVWNSGLHLKGWAIDPDTAAPVTVQAYFDNAFVGGMTANLSRPDVSTANPGYGDAHGFDQVLPLTAGPGPHTACLYGINIAAGDTNTQLGCRTVTVPSPPPAPSQTMAFEQGPNAVAFSWNNSYTDVSGYKVERAVANGAFSQIALVGPQRQSNGGWGYNDSALSPDTQYCYRVRAYNLYGDSPYSGTACAKTLLPAPTNLHWLATTPNTMTVAWTDNAVTESDNQITFAATGGGNAFTKSLGAHPGTGNMTYQATGLWAGTQYCVTVNSVPGDGRRSTPSAQMCASTNAATGGGGSGGSGGGGGTPPPGYSQLALWNCNVYSHAVHVWTFDANTTNGWQEQSTVNAGWNAYGQCGASVSSPYTLSLADQHLTYIVAVDPQDAYCGRNDPTYSGCQRWVWTVFGSSSGAAFPAMVQ